VNLGTTVECAEHITDKFMTIKASLVRSCAQRAVSGDTPRYEFISGTLVGRFPQLSNRRH